MDYVHDWIAYAIQKDSLRGVTSLHVAASYCRRHAIRSIYGESQDAIGHHGYRQMPRTYKGVPLRLVSEDDRTYDHTSVLEARDLETRLRDARVHRDADIVIDGLIGGLTGAEITTMLPTRSYEWPLLRVRQALRSLLRESGSP